MTIRGPFPVGTWNGASIPTFYGGTTFRSRTEARWAVFFDQLGLEWFYEYEGFVLPDGSRYLPDFWLPQLSMFVEVKPPDFDDLSEPIRAAFCGAERRLLLVHGAPGEMYKHWDDPDDMRVCGGTLLAPYWDGPYCFCFCPKCDRIGLTFDGRGGRVCGERCGAYEKEYTGGDTRLVSACQVARCWRFH